MADVTGRQTRSAARTLPPVNLKISRRIGAASCVALLGLSGCASSDRADSPASPAASSRATDGPAGTSAGRESEEIPPLTQQRWWAWAAAEPTATNPVADATGDHCARNQPADVWFVAGTFGGRVTRRCTLTAGRPIIAPLLNRVTTDEADCDDFLDAADGWAVMDQERVKPKKLTSERVRFDVVAGNPIFDSDGGRFQGVACGLWIALPSPEAGEHQLIIRGRAGDFQVWVEYMLDVQS